MTNQTDRPTNRPPDLKPLLASIRRLSHACADTAAAFRQAAEALRDYYSDSDRPRRTR